MTIFRRFFDVTRMKPALVRGDLPASRQVYKNTFGVAWPAILEAVLVASVGIIDTMMVGTISDSAIAAVGVTNQPRMIALSLFFAMNVGVTVVVARRKGEDNQKEANRVLRQSVLLQLYLSVVVAIFTGISFFSRPLLAFAGAGPEILGDASVYFNIVMATLPVNALTMCINAAQRGCGNTRISLVTNVTANAVNIVFNYLLINGIWFFPKLGVAGAAYATVLGNVVALCICLYSVFRPNGFLWLRIKGSLALHFASLKSVLSVSSSALAEQFFVRAGFFFYAKIVFDLGPLHSVTHTIAMQLASFSFCFGDGLSVAASSLVGQNMGRDRPDIALAHGKACQRIGFAFGLLLFCSFAMLRGVWFIPFSDNPEVAALGAHLVLILAFICPAQISQVILCGALRGAGDTRFVALLSLVCIGLLRPLLAYALCYPAGWGLIGAWTAFLVDQYLRLSLSLSRFSSGKWMAIKL